MIKKNLTRGLQFACGVAVVAAAVGATMHTNDTKAAASTPTGVCGLILSSNAAGYTGKNSSFGTGLVGLTGVVNLSGKTVALTATDVYNYNLPTAYNKTSPVSGTVEVGSQVPEGSGYVVTIKSTSDPAGSTGLPLLFVPTNNNNTYLVSTYKDQSTTQDGSPYMTGVCQVQ